MCHQWFADIQRSWLSAVLTLINGGGVFFDAMLDNTLWDIIDKFCHCGCLFGLMLTPVPTF